MWTLVMDMKIEICNISSIEVLVSRETDLGHDHAAVAGSEDQIGVMDFHAARLAEERHDEEPEQQQHVGCCNHSERYRSHRGCSADGKSAVPQKQADQRPVMPMIL